MDGGGGKTGKGILTKVKKNQITHEDFKTTLFKRIRNQ